LVSLSLRTHPEVLFGFSSHYIELILRVENKTDHAVWTEADITVPEHVSLSPNNTLKKGRVRVGIVEKNQFLEKAVRIFSNTYTQPQMYKCGVVLYVFSKDGVIESRMEKPYNLRCEMKKEASL
jgi:hypothetical protein